MPPRELVIRVSPDDPVYQRQAAIEAEFWARPQPGSIEAGELRDWTPTQTELYHNERFTGDPHVPWQRTLTRTWTVRWCGRRRGWGPGCPCRSRTSARVTPRSPSSSS